MTEYVITGGAGYIGRYLVESLLSKKQSVAVIDDLSTGKHVNKKAKFIRSDLRKHSDLRLPKESCFMHLAADPDVAGSMRGITNSFDRNVTATLNTLELARKHDAKTFLFTSSSTVYGEVKHFPTPEHHERRPASNYGAFKLISEELVQHYAENYGIRSIALRFANVTGGEVTHGIVKNWAECVKYGRPIEIWGDGLQQKSYVYYTDVINAILLCARKPTKQFEAFNVGSKDSLSVKQIRTILMGMAGPKLRTIYKPRQEGDVRAMLLDTRKISKETGWKAKFDSAEAIARSFKDMLK